MIRKYKCLNKYNYTIAALVIDYDNKSAFYYRGCYASVIDAKKTTRKNIKEMFNNLKLSGFNCEEV